MRANMTRLWCVLGVMAIAGGCSCPGPSECEDLFVTFEAPKDGMTAVPSTVDVTIKVANSAGGLIELDSAQLVSRPSSGTGFTVPRDGTLEAGKATFVAVTLEPGKNVLKVTVKKKGTACTGTKSIEVEVPVTNDPPKVVTFAYPQDTAMPTGVLNSIELPTASDLRIELVTQGAIGGTVQILNTANNTVLASSAIANSAVTVQVPAAALADGAYSLFAKVTHGSLSNSQTGNPDAVKMIAVDRTLPTCLVTTEKALVGPNDDANTTVAGYQVRATGNASAKAKFIALKISTPESTGSKSFTGAAFVADFLVPASGTQVYTFTVEATDSSGNVCTATTPITVDFEAPTLAITSPTMAGSPYSTFNIPLTATTTGGAVSVQFSTTLAGVKRDLGVLAVVANNATGLGSFQNGAQTVSAVATDALGNVSAPVTQDITVAAVGCPLTFSRPSANPVTLTQSNNSTPGAATLSYALEVTTTSACAGKSVSIRAVNNAGVAPQTLSGVTDGAGVYRSPNFVIPETAPASVNFEAQIDDGVGNVTKTTVTIIVNLQSPSLTFPIANFKVTAALDLQRAVAGGQYTLLYQPTLPAGASATVCTATQVVAGSMACPDGVGFVLANNVPQSTNTFNYPEGAYQLKVVFVFAGGGTAASSYVPIVVDTVRPTVVGVTFQGDANADGILNLSEQASGDPVALITTSGVENGQTLLVRLSTGTAVSPATAVTVVNNAATVPLPGLAAGSATEADFSLVVVVQDAVGNTNIVANPTANDPLNSAAITSLRVDRIRPTCSFILPNKAALGTADDADGALSGYQVTASVAVSADVQAAGATLTLTGGAAADVKTPTPSGGVATEDFTVAGTGETNYTVTCQVRDRAGNVNVTPNPTMQVLVDLVAPGCTLISPVAGGGTGSGGDYATYDIPTNVSVTNGNGLIARVFSQVGAAAEAQQDQMTVAAGTAQKTITFPSGTQTVRASVTDAAGNTCSTTQVIVVNAPGCSITFASPTGNPAFLNKSNDATPATAATLEYTLAGSTNCASQPIRFFTGTGAGKTELPGSPAMTGGTGGFSFPVSLPEGVLTLTAEMNSGGATARAVVVTVDLTDPVVTAVSPAGANFTFVAPGNYFLRPPATPGFIVDTDESKAGAQFVVSLNAAGAAGGRVSVLYQGVTVSGPVNIVTASESVTLPVTLSQNSTGPLTIRVSDAAGNVVDQTSSAIVDVVAPAAPVVLATLFAGKEREAIINLTWGPVYDDGNSAASGGLVPGPNGGYYDVRWTTSVVSAGLGSSDDFFNSAMAYADSTSAWSSATISRDVLTPPLVTTRYYVRARDEVGNYSAFVPAGAGQTVNNPWNIYSLAAPTSGAGKLFGFVTAANGSLNSDAVDDLVVSAQAADRVFVYYGGSSFGNAAPQEIQPPDSVLGAFGADCSVGNAADDGTGSTKKDLLVGSPTANMSAGRALLFFGRNQPQLGTTAADYVVFAGNAASQLGRSAQIVRDLDGDGIDDIFLAGDNENSNRGRVYLFYGRSEAAWKALPQPIPMSSADRNFMGPLPSPAAGNGFGSAPGGFANLGRLGTSGPSDFVIPASLESANRIFIFGGSVVSAADAGTVFTTGGIDAGIPDDSLQSFAKPTHAPASQSGYGVRVIGGVNVTGGSALDLIVSWATGNRVMIHTDRTGALFPGESTTITGPPSSFFGSDVLALDLAPGSGTDLVVSHGFSTSANIWVFKNRRLAGMEFDTVAGVGFWQAKLSTIPGTSGLGTRMSSGDFNGDGKRDIAAGDFLDGNGKVTVWNPP